MARRPARRTAHTSDTSPAQECSRLSQSLPEPGTSCQEQSQPPATTLLNAQDGFVVRLHDVATILSGKADHAPVEGLGIDAAFRREELVIHPDVARIVLGANIQVGARHMGGSVYFYEVGGGAPAVHPDEQADRAVHGQVAGKDYGIVVAAVERLGVA